MRKRNATITIRCTENERQQIYNKACQHGLTLSDFVLRSALGKRIIVAEGLDEVIKQQKIVGNNLNQLCTLVHMDRVHAVNLDKLIAEQKQITTLLSEIVKVIQ